MEKETPFPFSLRESTKIRVMNIAVHNEVPIPINKVVANHTHPSPLFAKPTFQSLENIVIIPQKMLEQAKDTAFDIEAFYNEVNNFRTFWLAQDRPFLSKKNKTN